MMAAMQPPGGSSSSFPPVRGSSRAGSPSKGQNQLEMLQARLYHVEAELATKESMNTMLQAKLSGVLRKCDSKEQKLNTATMAMRKMEGDMQGKLAKLTAETAKAMSGEKYDRMQDDLRRRASSIMAGESRIAALEDKLETTGRKAKATAFQLKTAREQAAAAEAEVVEEKKRAEKLNSQLATANIKLRDMQHSLNFTGDQLEEREMETAQLRVTVQMLQEDLEDLQAGGGGGGGQRGGQPPAEYEREIAQLRVENKMMSEELRAVNERVAAQIAAIDMMAQPVRAKLAEIAKTDPAPMLRGRETPAALVEDMPRPRPKSKTPKKQPAPEPEQNDYSVDY
eukprot:SAG22_NODE_1130_length_5458_cov_2.715619_3_plen_340_part_00